MNLYYSGTFQSENINNYRKSNKTSYFFENVLYAFNVTKILI